MCKPILGRDIVIILILVFMTTELFSQIMTVEQIDTDLHNTYSKILFYRYGESIEWDSIEKENLIFNAKISQFISKNPQTLTFPFDSLLKDNFKIVSSEDNLLRIYSWDTWMGGTMHYFNNIYQYKTGENVLSEFYDSDNGGPSCFYSQINTLKANDKTYYLAINNQILSTKDVVQSIQILAIENKSLNDSVNLIRTEDGYVSSIDVSFDYFSVVERPERPIELIKYDKDLKTIYIPIVNDNGKVTDSFTLYKFTGQYFEHIETEIK